MFSSLPRRRDYKRDFSSELLTLLDRAIHGSNAWNHWRDSNADQPVDFSYIDFTEKTPCGVDLPSIDFRGFNFGNNVNFDCAKFGSWERIDKDNNKRTHGCASFDLSNFGNNISFRSTMFGDRPSFRRAKFKCVNFSNAIFGEFADFVDVEIGLGSSLKGVTYGNNSIFAGALLYDADFSYSTFRNGANFEVTNWVEMPNFRRAKFGDYADFSGCFILVMRVYTHGFDEVKFGAHARFDGCGSHTLQFSRSEFGPNASFEGLSIDKYLGRFENKQYGKRFIQRLKSNPIDAQNNFFKCHKMHFSYSQFDGPASFAGRQVSDFADFRGVKFRGIPDFEGGIDFAKISLTGASFDYKISNKGNHKVFANWTSNPRISTGWRKIRRLAENHGLQDVERDLFIAERLADRGVLWSRCLRRPSFGSLSLACYSTAMAFIYGFISDFGRSVLRPAILYVLLQAASYYLFQRIHSKKSPYIWDEDAASYVFGNAVPILGNLGAQRRSLLERLFASGADGLIDVPFAIEVLTVAQSTFSAVLLFLILLAIRNHFRIK